MLVKLVIAKGGGLADINVGDAIEYVEAHREQRPLRAVKACSIPG
ncbi:hypothetical protein OG949_35335 [Streptomyces scopuliridis]|nr:hypothetical protein [Streptomyces scopuliridis]WSB37582.1 hypothetical protein OG949_35335 [Streptomyces scopuliridis]